MTSDEALLRPDGREDLTDCRTLLTRLVRLDSTGLVRLQRADGRVRLWARPLAVVVRRDVRAQLTVQDRTVSAAQLLAAVDTCSAGDVRLPAPRDEAWGVTLPPPRAGWSRLDAVPVDVLRNLADGAGRTVRAAADPAAAGKLLLDREILRVSRDTDEVVLPVRVVVVLNRVGFLGASGHAADVVQVACTSAWVRLAARHGTAYHRRGAPGLSLA